MLQVKSSSKKHWKVKEIVNNNRTLENDRNKRWQRTESPMACQN